MNDLSSIAPPTDLETMIAQLIFPRIGSNLNPSITVEEDEPRIAELVQNAKIGGLCLFHGHWPTTAATLQRLQRLSAIPLLVAADIEQGVGQQIHGRTLFPHAMAFDALEAHGDAYLTRFARSTAREALDTGIHIALGPVADVHSDPNNPIISTRAFGTDPAVVATRVATYIQAAQADGLLCTAKHFPGHGDTAEDSHDRQPVVLADRRTLDARELLPFRAAVQANVHLIMTAHVAYPALDATGTVATLSEPILIKLLRDELGFRGAVVSDSLLMAGVRAAFDSEVELALATLNAGVDILLDIGDPVGTIRGIADAVHTRRLPASRIQQAFQRVWHLKQHRGLFRSPSLSDLTASSQQLADEIARAACRRIGTWKPLPTPLTECQSVGVILVTSMAENAYGTRFLRQNTLAESLRQKCPRVDSTIVSASTPSPLNLPGITQADHLILALLVKPAAWQQFGLLPPQWDLVHAMLRERQSRSLATTVVALGSPHVLDEVPHAERRLCTFSDVPASQRAVAAILSE